MRSDETLLIYFGLLLFMTIPTRLAHYMINHFESAQLCTHYQRKEPINSDKAS